MSCRSVAVLWGLAAVALTVGCAQESSQPSAESIPAEAGGTVAPASAPSDADAVERGRYLVTVAGCNDCHTPLVMGPQGPMPDMTRMLSGHPESLVMPPPPPPTGAWDWAGASTVTAFAGAWGISYAANLTPDPSGMGAWDEETFIRALRTGKHMGQSRPILPPMPWPNLAQATDEDLRAIFAYLRSIPPIENHVPEAVVAPPPAGVAEASGAPGGTGPTTAGE